MARQAVTEVDEAVARLVELGLSASEARCYVSLLHIAPATAGELADAAGVARPKVYGLLKSLEQRSFCYPSGDRVTTYRPVDPGLALDEWTRAREHQRRLAAEHDRGLRAELVAMLPEAPEPGIDRSAELPMELTGGPGETVEVIENLMQHAERRLDILLAPPVVQQPEHWNRYEIEALRRGVQVRMLIVGHELAVKHRSEEILAAGGEVRVAREAPLKVMIRDDGAEATVALRIPGEERHQIFLAVRHTDLVAPMQLLFNREWRRAKPLAVPETASVTVRK